MTQRTMLLTHIISYTFIISDIVWVYLPQWPDEKTDQPTFSHHAQPVFWHSHLCSSPSYDFMWHRNSKTHSIICVSIKYNKHMCLIIHTNTLIFQNLRLKRSESSCLTRSACQTDQTSDTFVPAACSKSRNLWNHTKIKGNWFNQHQNTNESYHI